MLENDKQYVLFDTIVKGIYIFDIQTKTKLAVCDVCESGEYLNIYRVYQRMIKLKTGHVIPYKKLIYLGLVDIKGRKEEQIYIHSDYCFFIKDNYIIGTTEFGEIVVYQFCD